MPKFALGLQRQLIYAGQQPLHRICWGNPLKGEMGHPGTRRVFVLGGCVVEIVEAIGPCNNVSSHSCLTAVTTDLFSDKIALRNGGDRSIED